MTRRQLNAVLASTLLALSACEIPRFEGPQIQEPPVGFRLQPESAEQARLFPGRELTFHSTWVHTDMSGVSLIHVNGHPGALTIEDVIAGFDAVRTLRQDPDLAYGEIEALRIDGRDGWGWAERIQSPSRGLVEVSYRAVIPYDTVTYAIEFFSGEPMWKQYAPDTLKAVIGTFAVGETTLNVPLIAMVVGAVLLLVSVLRARANERKTRLRSINLVQFKKPDEDEDDSAHSTGLTVGSRGT